MAERGDIIIGEGKIKFGLEYRDLLSDQGVCVHALGEVDGEEVELLRFDCFDHAPHYHYGPEKRNERLMLEKTTEGDSLDWTMRQLREHLPEMLRRAGYDDLASNLDVEGTASTIDATEAEARKLAREGRAVVTHDRGEVIVEAGPVRFGIEFRELANDRGVAIHVLGDAGSEEVELLTFDCFEVAPTTTTAPARRTSDCISTSPLYPARWSGRSACSTMASSARCWSAQGTPTTRLGSIQRR